MQVRGSSQRHFTLDQILQDIPEIDKEEIVGIEATYESYKSELNYELKTTDKIWLEFQAGQCVQYGKAAKSILYRIVKSSINHPENSIAAANAITILKTMKVSLSCLDLRGIQIPGADLSHAILDMADISSANLESANLACASLNSTNMQKTNLNGAKFDLPYTFLHEQIVLYSVISPDNKYLVTQDGQYMTFWDLQTKACIKKIDFSGWVREDSGGIKDADEAVRYLSMIQKIFTPDGKFLLDYDRKQNVDIYSVGTFDHIQTIRISDQENTYTHFSFSSNENQLITCSYSKSINLKLWELTTENNLLILHLKNEISHPSLISNIQFSKKHPIIYCLKVGFTEQGDGKKVSGITLCIWDKEKLSEIATVPIPDISEILKLDLNYFWHKNLAGWTNNFFSLEILSTNDRNGEVLFIAIEKTIYSIQILMKNEQSYSLENYKITKLTVALEDTFKMQILANTQELIYLNDSAICLYSIETNQSIGKFRLIDKNLSQLLISPDGQSVYIHNGNLVYMYSIDALKGGKNFSLEVKNNLVRFSPNTSSIISLTSGYYKHTYDIENGISQSPDFLVEACSKVLNRCLKAHAFFSPCTQYIAFRGIRRLNISDGLRLSELYSEDFNADFLQIIDIENKNMTFEYTQSYNEVMLSNDSEYIALTNHKKIALYKHHTSKCIGEFSFNFSLSFQIALSTDFGKNPKVALLTESKKLILCTFTFKGEDIEILSQKEYFEEIDGVLQLKFTENNTKLIIACIDKLMAWDMKQNKLERYDIKASNAHISEDGTRLIYYYMDEEQFHKGYPCNLYVWGITEKKSLVVQSFNIGITEMQISSNNQYILLTTENQSLYVLKILEGSFRLLWRTSNDLQTQGLILGDNNLEKDVEDNLITKMGAIKLQQIDKNTSKRICQVL